MKQTLSARQREVARMLLTRTDPVTVAALADRFGVSARTMRYDLDALTEWFDEQQLSLVKKPRYGVEVAGSGDAKREALSPRPPKVRIAGGKPGFNIHPKEVSHF